MKEINKKVKEKFENFFDWIKGAELVELKSCDPNEDPIRPELNNDFRICPACSSKSLKTENGCDSCMSCGYSKCDK